MNFARPIKKRIDDGFRSTLPLTAMNQWGGGKKEKKNTIDRRASLTIDVDARRESAKWQSEREWYGERFICVSTVVYRGVSRAFVTCFGGISPHSARRTGRVYGPSRDCSWCCIRTWNRGEKKDIVKICSAARWDEKWNSIDSLIKRSKRVILKLG